jgi:hypothetical protein
MDIYKSRERGREDVSINTGNIEALALSGDSEHFVLSAIHFLREKMKLYPLVRHGRGALLREPKRVIIS